MRFVGLSALQLSLTLAGVSAVVVALYLLKQNPRRVKVVALPLWGVLLGRRDTATLWTRLRRLWSLLLALLIVALVSFALGDVRRKHDARTRSVVLLVDASASMAATDVPPSRLEVARAATRTLVDALAPGDRAIVVQLDAQATPLSTVTEDATELRSALARVRQTDLASDLARGVRFALDVLAREKNPEIVLVSDGNLSSLAQAERELGTRRDVRFRYVKVGASERNLAITSFSVRSYPLDRARHESIVTVTSFAREDERVRLRVRASGTLLYEETLAVPHGQSVTRTLENLTSADDVLEASITPERGPDMLTRDDSALATLPSRAHTRVLTVSEGNRYLEAALLLDEYLDVDDVTPAKYRGAQGYDVVVFDRALPDAPPSVPAIYLGPTGASSPTAPLAVRGEVSRPYFEKVEREHPLVRFTALADVNIARASALTLDAKDHVIASSAGKLPLLVEGSREGVRFVALAFDVRESDLPLRAAWPLFLLGAIDHLTRTRGASIAEADAGTVREIVLPAGIHEATLAREASPSERLVAHGGSVRIAPIEKGLYVVRAGELSAKLAVNVPASLEGAIAPLPRLLGQDGASLAPSAARSLLGERTWPWLVALALLLLSVEWLTFHRRWTV